MLRLLKGNRGSSTILVEDDIFYTRGRIFILERASGEFEDENSIPKCKKYHPLPHEMKNIFLPRPINKQ